MVTPASSTSGIAASSLTAHRRAGQVGRRPDRRSTCGTAVAARRTRSSPCAARWRRRTRRGPRSGTPRRRDRSSRRSRCRGGRTPASTARCRRRSMLCFISSTISGAGRLDVDAGRLRASKRSCLADACWANSPRKQNSASPGSSAAGVRLGDLEEVLEAGHHDGLEQGLFGGEVAVQGPHAHPGPLGHGVDGDRQALGGEDRLGRLEDALAVLHGVGPHGAGLHGPVLGDESVPVGATRARGPARSVPWWS